MATASRAPFHPIRRPTKSADRRAVPGLRGPLARGIEGSVRLDDHATRRGEPGRDVVVLRHHHARTPGGSVAPAPSRDAGAQRAHDLAEEAAPSEPAAHPDVVEPARTADRAPDQRDLAQPGETARQPVVGEGDVVRDVEVHVTVQAPGQPRQRPLPERVVPVEVPGAPAQPDHPRRQVEVLHAEVPARARGRPRGRPPSAPGTGVGSPPRRRGCGPRPRRRPSPRSPPAPRTARRRPR